MSSSTILPTNPGEAGVETGQRKVRSRRSQPAGLPFRIAAQMSEIDAPYRHAELFYLQKQIQAQTPMVIVLEDGERIEGCIEWYDRNTIKVRGRGKTLVFKSAIKYIYKLEDNGTGSGS
jgi:sRNA-binding regulator protein Hfq